MVNKKELIKTIKKECLIELDTKKLQKMEIPMLQELLVDFRNLKMTSMRELNKPKRVLEEGEGFIQ